MTPKQALGRFRRAKVKHPSLSIKRWCAENAVTPEIEKAIRHAGANPKRRNKARTFDRCEVPGCKPAPGADRCKHYWTKRRRATASKCCPDLPAFTEDGRCVDHRGEVEECYWARCVHPWRKAHAHGVCWQCRGKG